MKVLITDDETLARDRLRALVEEAGHEVIGEAATGKQALQQYDQLQPDIVLLDIRMPEMDGIEAARHLSALDDPPAIIFTTAYDDHALAAFETHALDYLLKPVRRERLQQTLAQAHRLNRAQQTALHAVDGEHSVRTHISVQSRDGIRLVPIEDVIYFLADQKYVAMYHLTGNELINESLKQLEGEFAGRFIRIHRNALVALAYIEGMEKDGAGSSMIQLRGMQDTLEVSRRHIAQVRKHLRNAG